MPITHTFFLGLLQGATEFLPISSSGHLVLVPWLLGWPVPSLAFDALVHWATAFAVLGYFWHDWAALLRGLWRALRSRSWDEPNARLAILIVVGTIPGAVIGWLLEDFFEGIFSRPRTAAAFLLVTAALLTFSERWGQRERTQTIPTWSGALVVGMAQALAIFPGISRSGATIAAGMTQGLQRKSAARFSFLLATPIILGAGLLQISELFQAGSLTVQAPALLAGFLAALLMGLACIHLLLRYLQRRPLYPFALYCALFGIFNLAFSFLAR